MDLVVGAPYTGAETLQYGGAVLVHLGTRAGGGYTLEPAASRCPLHRAAVAVAGVTRHEALLHRGPLQPRHQSGGQRGHAGGGGTLRRGGGEAEGGRAGEGTVDV